MFAHIAKMCPRSVRCPPADSFRCCRCDARWVVYLL